MRKEGRPTWAKSFFVNCNQSSELIGKQRLPEGDVIWSPELGGLMITGLTQDGEVVLRALLLSERLGGNRLEKAAMVDTCISQLQFHLQKRIVWGSNLFYLGW